MMGKRGENAAVAAFLLVYFALNLLFLESYPLVHSDESWLAGLTRNMMDSKSLAVTEPFFDLKPRYPHAVKFLFHLLQMPFIAVFGYSAFAVRLLSLCAGCATLFLIYVCCRKMASYHLSLAVTALVSIDGQFVAAAHTARQEVLLLFASFSCLLILIRIQEKNTRRDAMLLALICGLSASLHPNGALVAAGCFCSLLFRIFSSGRKALQPLAVFSVLTLAAALFLAAASFMMDRGFLSHYLLYGESEFDILATPGDKFLEFGLYIQKLWLGISGTYCLPCLKVHLVIFPLLVVLGIWRAKRSHDIGILPVLGMITGAVLATIVIGRYNQLSASLWMTPCFLLLAPLLSSVSFKKAAMLIVSTAFAVCSLVSIVPRLSSNYSAYLDRIALYTAPEEKVLGNLNCGFYFKNDALLDLRNLSYLKEHGLSFAEYVQSRGIKVILWPDEMDYIYNRRPVWNIIYGNPRYVPEAETFFAACCELAGTFEDTNYAMRICQEIGKPYSVRVYRVLP